MNISDYGIIGNCRSSALVSKYGSIDWCCLPDFDSPSVLARLLDEDIGGHFSITPDGDYSVLQQYVNHSNILETRFTSASAEFRILDFMPIYRTDESHYYNAPEIYRILSVIRGTPAVKVNYKPALNYARPTSGKIDKNYIKHVTTEGRYESIYLYTSLSKEEVMNGEKINLTGDNFFCLTYNQKLLKMSMKRAWLEYQRTKVYWMNWSNRTLVFNRYNEEITRSSLLLKLLTYGKSGAVIAAPTTSLPETVGETRNWDYRFCWIRDSSMVIKTFLQMGHTNSAREFQKFLLSVNQGKQEDIQIMYGLRGEKDLEEKILEHLSGFRNSPPVRIGNGAYLQKQNDIYGELIDAIYLSLHKFPSTLDTSEELWTFVRSIVAVVAKQWKKPDKSIWEIRGAERHFVYSKAMSWVAVDRGVKIARMLDRDFYVDEWSLLADTIREDIFANGWDEEVGAFVQHYGSKHLDASNLLLEEIGLVDVDDPRYISTVLKTKAELCRNGFMFRYINEDDFGVPKSSFVLCTFWLVNSLYKIGHRDEALEIFHNILGCTNHLGLLSEHIDIDTKELLGNFPQAYSHLGLIQSALLINGEDISFENEIFRFIKP
ncbi:MAG: glycoside hydrolase family 15 protein [Bacteroidales bacterium]